MARTKVVIMGAAGRDFHNFNCLFRDNEDYDVVALSRMPSSAWKKKIKDYADE